MSQQKPKRALYEVLFHFDEAKKKARVQYRPLHPTLKRILYKNSLLGDEAMYKIVTEARLIERPLLANGDWSDEAGALSIAAIYHKIMKNATKIEQKLDEKLAFSMDTSLNINIESLEEVMAREEARSDHIKTFNEVVSEVSTETESKG